MSRHPLDSLAVFQSHLKAGEDPVISWLSLSGFRWQKVIDDLVDASITALELRILFVYLWLAKSLDDRFTWRAARRRELYPEKANQTIGGVTAQEQNDQR